jgi:predicted ATPase/DNA-binding SARP family transcriptional activator
MRWGQEAMSRLGISLLGPFQVTLNGVSVTHFGADTARALLAYLAMDPHTPHRRETLAGLLWPDQPESAARHNLSQALLRLRAAIRDRDAVPLFLLATRETIQLNPESDYWLDVSAFEDAMAFAETHEHRRADGCAACVEHLIEAIRLYQGEFLAGFSLPSILFEEWVVVERERLHRLALEALGQLAAYHEVQGAYAEAACCARRTLVLEPWSEPAHRQLMRALALNGDRSAALAQYEACCRVLREELAVEPEEETTRLYERIRDQSETRSLPEIGSLGNLPSLPTPTVGREDALSKIDVLLDDPDCRLLTLVGLGGIGKTRLAIETARRRISRHVDGVYFVPLAGIPSPSGVVPAIAGAVELTLSEGGDPTRQLLGYLRDKETLLVLDNYEHLLSDPAHPTAFVSELLRAAPQVQLLVTSRERLNVQGEQLYPVRGMRYPQEGEPLEQVAACSAVQLFLASARRVCPGYEPGDEEELEAVGHLCRMAGGMPLAIELAAAWVDMLSPGEIMVELERSLAFLRSSLRDVPEEHHSMLAVLDASWGMMSEAEQKAFAALSVFRGGCMHEAAEAVTGAALETLRALLLKSFLTRDEGGRYQMHELLRHYAEDKLRGQPQARERALDRHCTYYARWMVEREELLERGEVRRLLPEIENVHAGWCRAVQQLCFAELRQYRYLAWLYEFSGRFGEAEAAFGWADEVLRAAYARGLDKEATTVVAVALMWESRLLRHAGQREKAVGLLQEAISLLCGVNAQEELAVAMMEVVYAGLVGFGTEARQLVEEGLVVFRERGNDLYVAAALNNLAEIALRGGDTRTAEEYCREALQVSEPTGNRRLIAWSLETMGKAAYARGQYDAAIRYGERALALWRQIGFRRQVVVDCCLLGEAHYAVGALTQAARYHHESADFLVVGMDWDRALSGEYYGAIYSLCRLGDIYLAQGSAEEAERIYSRALRAAVDAGSAALLYAVVRQGERLARAGQLVRAAEVATLVRDHPESIPEARERALALLAEMEERLSPRDWIAIQEQGHSALLQEMVEELLEQQRE